MKREMSGNLTMKSCDSMISCANFFDLFPAFEARLEAL